MPQGSSVHLNSHQMGWIHWRSSQSHPPKKLNLRYVRDGRPRLRVWSVHNGEPELFPNLGTTGRLWLLGGGLWYWMGEVLRERHPRGARGAETGSHPRVPTPLGTHLPRYPAP